MNTIAPVFHPGLKATQPEALPLSTVRAIVMAAEELGRTKKWFLDHPDSASARRHLGDCVAAARDINRMYGATLIGDHETFEHLDRLITKAATAP
jgi:hypothetical protein